MGKDSILEFNNKESVSDVLNELLRVVKAGHELVKKLPKRWANQGSDGED